MSFLALIGHLANFIAPAIGVALLLWGLPRIWPKARAGRWDARRELMALCALGVAVLLAGLVVFGRDGKMLSYTALVLAQGSLGWWLRRR
ncbi:hypothetical protein [Hydrogenophaga pseudoflava]|uniref:Uncharacterized protein n=1 Tax=Hydrogenophaga pseudoflava TaxID=47421 RepID=A0A4P6X5P5_HYDPS|nr:hypothetical protein [Hydrogenophaga pseudoflava]QBM29878.1 hypothetical protein HPF_19450 [Hydrogenophaga pseudoflava]